MARFKYGRTPQSVPDFLDHLGLIRGHYMRDEFERLVISFYMDNKHPHRQLLGVSKPEFKVMVEEFAKDAGPRFWGKASRLHLSSSAPTWSGSRSIVELLRLLFGRIARTERDKRVAERKKQYQKQYQIRARERKAKQRADLPVGGCLTRPELTDQLSHSAHGGGGTESNELARNPEQERSLVDDQNHDQSTMISTPEQRVLRPTRGTAGPSRNDAKGTGGNASLLAKRRTTKDGNQQKRKVRARSGEQRDASLSIDKEVLAHAETVLRSPATSIKQENVHELDDEVMEIDAPQRALLNKHQQQNTTLHFFLSDTDLGAIPKTLHKCMTLTTFFGEALAAWRDLESESSTPGLISVKFDWKSIPMVIRWHDPEGFQKMLEAIAAAPCWQGSKDQCDVEIRCAKRKSQECAK